jgi:hypothetical protein
MFIIDIIIQQKVQPALSSYHGERYRFTKNKSLLTSRGLSHGTLSVPRNTSGALEPRIASGAFDENCFQVADLNCSKL